MIRYAWLLLLTACAPRFALAQVEPDSIKQRNNCRLAIQAVSTGHPAPKLEWALSYIANCSDGGHALAEAMTAARLSADTAELNAITAPTIQLRDGEIFETALSIASDRSASPEARVFAIRTLIWSMWPGGGIEFADLAGDRGQRTCGGGPSTHLYVVQGKALPLDYIERAKSLARRLNLDDTEVMQVRRAAVCLAGTSVWPRLP